MKHLVAFIVAMALACLPGVSFAQKNVYVGTPTSSNSSGPKRAPALDLVVVSSEGGSGELCITFAGYAPGLAICLEKDGAVYEEDELDAHPGKTVVYDLGDYEDGVYSLAVKVGGETVCVYSITIEE